jgi:hypothetical protein
MTETLFDILPQDRTCYETQIRDFLPEQIIDIHTHVWLNEFTAKNSDELRRAVSWPALVAKDNSIDDLIETYRLMLPGKQVTPLIFSNLQSRHERIDDANDYIVKSAKKHNYPSLLFAMPWWSESELEKKLLSGNFLGVKVYLTLSDPAIPFEKIQIFDFLPHHQLSVLNRRRGIVILHIPRPGRLKDPANIQQMIEIENRYPEIKLVIAHVGRAYCPEGVGNAFEILSKTKSMRFDISANTSVENFEKLILAVGPKRILFGSDLPIARMRMRRICENGKYVNLVPSGLYGDVSSDPNMREVDEHLTFFLYEEIKAFLKAARQVGLSANDIKDVFYTNALEMISEN